MAARDLDAARRHVESAEAYALAPADQASARRADRLVASLETFWKAVRAEAAALPSGKELQFGGTYILVVESSPRGLTVRAGGKTRVWRIEELPRELILALFQRRMGKDSPLAHLHIGSFFAADREGDRQQARRHWQQAGLNGKQLLPLLER
jgi:hypothetical protein